MSARKSSQPPGGSLAVLVLDIDGRPTLAFEASDATEAQEICGSSELRADLAALTSDGAPLCTPHSTLSARLAVPEEIAAFQHALARAPASDQPTMTFLVRVDGVVVVTVGPEQA